MRLGNTHGGYMEGIMSIEHDKENIKRRLRRIEGQLRGIQGMIEHDACCMDILVQISAARAAISKAGVIILENHIKGCLMETLKKENPDETLDELMKVMSNFIK